MVPCSPPLPSWAPHRQRAGVGREDVDARGSADVQQPVVEAGGGPLDEGEGRLGDDGDVEARAGDQQLCNPEMGKQQDAVGQGGQMHSI